MNALLEQLNKNLFKKYEVSEVSPVLMSKILSPDDSMSRRESQITKFFGEPGGGFTYKKFKAIISPGLGNIFGVGADSGKKISPFAKRTEGKDEAGDVEILYDEYVETFFMYLYYQLFVKLFSNHEVILSKNKEAIENAKDLISAVPESLEGDMEENLVKLYRSFLSIFASSLGDVASISKSEESQQQYFENFANQNVGLYTRYPISVGLKGAGEMGVKDLMDAMFDALKDVSPEDSGSKQILSIKMLSNFVKGGSPDFDIVRFQELTKEYPSFLADQGEIRFPSKLEAVISDVITEISSMEDIDDVGMDWAKGTSWEPYVKMLCGIISLEEVSGKVKSIAKTVRKQKSTYQKRLDVGEQDGGVYFVNNQAFVDAASKVPQTETLVKDLNDAIRSVAKKTKMFQSLSGKELVKAMFVEYNPDGAAVDFASIPEKEAIEKIMKMTKLIPNMGGNVTDAVAEINRMLFNKEKEIRGNPNDRNEDAIEYAMDNVGDFILPEIRKDTLDAFTPRAVVGALEDIAAKTAQAFSKIFSGKFDFGNAIDTFNETFKDEFDFAEIRKSSGDTYVIRMGNRDVYTIESPEDLKKYVNHMCISMGSIMYHSKVAFGKEGNRDSRYNDYFNTLSWFVEAVHEKGKDAALATPDYPFVYLVTPFLLEVVKYSFRTFVNEIEEVLFQEGLIGKDLKDRVRKSHNADSMEEEEWKPMVEELSEAIESYLKKAVS